MLTLSIARADEYLELLRERLPDHTLRHCVSVAGLMQHLAPLLGISLEGAVTAGLLHDSCKAMKKDELLARANKYGIELTEVHRARPQLLHGPVAAEECRRKFDLQSPDLYEAIYWHTTGKPGLNRMGQALYFADFSEPYRVHEEAAMARAILDAQGFDAALKFVAEAKLGILGKKGREIDPVTESFCSWLDGENGRAHE
ncbi:MAG: HD domain-containing protein [Candidatus Hydrogenedentes bacterium]|nr:HD domain-containing protein [Candidatus Hydrogenedentota bacterium]